MKYPSFIVPLVVPVMREKEVKKQRGRVRGQRDVRTERYGRERGQAQAVG